jgi:hypothetical protein
VEAARRVEKRLGGRGGEVVSDDLGETEGGVSLDQSLHNVSVARSAESADVDHGDVHGGCLAPTDPGSPIGGRRRWCNCTGCSHDGYM